MNKIVKPIRRILISIFELSIVMMLLVMLVTSAALWKFSKGPVDITFAAKYLESAIIDQEAETQVEFGSVVAEWPEFSGPIILGISQVIVKNQGQVILSVPKLGVQLSKLPFVFGAIKPQAIIVTDPILNFVRGKNGDFHLFVGKDIKKRQDEATETNIKFSQLADAFFQGGNLPDYPELQPLSDLQRISVKNATLVMDDYKAGVSWQMPRANLELERQKNKFDLQVNYAMSKRGADQDKVSALALIMERKNNQIEVQATLDNIDLASVANIAFPNNVFINQEFFIKSKINGVLDNDWNPQKLMASVSSDNGKLSLDTIYDVPLTFSKLSGEVLYDKQQHELIVDNTHVDINGMTVSLKSEQDMHSNDDYIPVTISVPQITFDEIHKLWPNEAKDTQLAEWLVTKLSKGTVSDLSLMFQVNKNDISDIPEDKIEAKFSYKNLSVDYRPPMIPVDHAQGTGSIKNDILNIKVESAKISDLNVKSANISIDHLTHPTEIGDVNIAVELQGDVKTALDYIEKEPISLGEKIGVDKTQVKGTLTSKVDVVFPALADLPAEDVKVKVKATMDDVVFPEIVRGLNLSGGPFDLTVDGNYFEIDGKGKLSNQNIDLNYSEYINIDDAPYSSKITASMKADLALRKHFGVNLDEFISGTFPVKINYLEKTPGLVDLDVDVDMTPGKFFIVPMNYYKKEGVQGNASAKIILKNGDVDHINDLNVKISDGSSALGGIKFGKVSGEWDVSHVAFRSVKLGKYNEFKLDIDIPQKDLLDIEVSGKSFDGRPFIGSEMKEGGAVPENIGTESTDSISVNAKVNVQKLYGGSETNQFLSGANISLKTNKNQDITFLDLSGKTQSGVFNATMKPTGQGGRIQLKAHATNAGEALRVMDLYEHIRGGELQLKAEQIQGAGLNDLRGRAQIKDFSVVKAPFLAKLINLFSLSGLSELLQNKGIEFERLRAEFEWKEEKGERYIIVKDGKTKGSSIGLSFSGTINQTKNETDISGTVVPISQVNGMVSKIPVLGKLLGGESGGLIAATYTMKGDSDDPKVFINPLSVLTPGFLRSILFENDVDFDDPLPSSSNDKKNNANERSRYNQ